MKPIGPYVAARELPGPAGTPLPATPVRTLRATDRLTGMPVLLHVLPYALNLPTLPEHPHLLPITDSGMDGENAYVVTELPPYAQPASDPRLSAPGALSALAALHASGLTHGGVTPAQLWQFGGTVALAGAGLPWRETEATPEGDLRDLAHALQALRALPTPLRPLLETPQGWTAEQALARLHGHDARTVSLPEPEQRPEQRRPDRQEGEDAQSAATSPPSGASEIVTAAPTETAATASAPETGPKAEAGPEAGAVSEGAGTITDWLAGPVSGSISVPRSGSSSGAPPEPSAPTIQGTTSGELAPEGSATPPVTGLADTIVASSSPPPPTVTEADAGPATEAAPPPKPAVSPFSNAPAGQPETPQERRRRQNEERRAQAMLDSQAAAKRKAQRIQAERERAEREGATGTDAAVPPPIQIGFPDGDAPGAPRLSGREVDRLPASLRRPGAGTGQPSRLPPTASTPLPARRGDPIRIGWDEDESWRVIRTPVAPPPPAYASLSRWVVPGVAAVVLLLILIWAWSALSRPANPVGTVPAAACCTVPVTLRGAAGVTATLTVEKAPQGAKVQPGQPLGQAPGTLNFPVEGTYRLQVTAQGYTPAILTVTVPRTQPVTINLGN